MKRLILLTIITFIAVIDSATAQNLLDGPETVIYDASHNRYLVSNIHNGHIVQVDEYGSYTLFSNQFPSTWGMAISGDVLYVNCASGPYAGTVGLDLETAEIVFHHPTETYGENGMTVDTAGNLYIADTGGSRVLKLDPESGVITTVSGIAIPNAIVYDPKEHRVLVTSNVWWTPVAAISLIDGTATTVTTTTGQFSGLTWDQLGNLYIAFFANDRVERVDSLLYGSPEMLPGYDGPEGIFFDQRRSTLVVPALMADQLVFDPMNIDVWMECDTVFGWAPLEVNFEGFASFDIDSWSWDFGDGGTATDPAPSHTFSQPGFFTINLTAVTTDNDTLFREYQHHVGVVADTLAVSDVEVTMDGTLEVVIGARNTLPLNQLDIPVRFADPAGLVLDSISTEGCRTEHFQSVQVIDQDSLVGEYCFRLRARPSGSPLYLNPGSGEVLKLYFRTEEPFSLSGDEISMSGYSAIFAPGFTRDELEYEPVAVSGEITGQGCCGLYTGGITGNANCSDDGKLTLSDISRMIDRVYISKALLCCEANGNTNADEECKITLSDISRLIDAVFISKQPPSGCMAECS